MLLKQSLSLLLTTIALLLPVSSVLARGISTLRATNPNTRINVRSQPTINSSAPQYGLPGDKVQVIECVQDKDTRGSDLNWCKVQFVKSKAIGWIRSDFIIFADGGE
ncbi:SH3 domain-containing protein [Crocosphaera sp. UHCC 0190]|uniref:SH3 domain-containing protein n=1 Tax=Crocosphaera sp. UHCC 0190 TaxID=3110246 RepID=UPI002B1F0916|nr:SH3 domain-containing protein [Crocosphaera sp. UHCC 0190]MEA5512221.1 SH3 domain-containing protein [Crocosphaera sp. UHCC 0190]